MSWIERLNRAPNLLPLGGGTAEVLFWAHSPYLLDNRPHRHTFFEVCQVGSHGRGTFFVEGQPHHLEPGTLFFARPGVEHQIVNTMRPRMELTWVSWTWKPPTTTEAAMGGSAGEEVASLLRAFAASPLAACRDEGGRVTAHWKALEALSESGPRPGYEAQAQAVAGSLLVALAQAGAGSAAPAAFEPTGPNAGTMLARAAVQYISDNLDRGIGLDEVASHVHLSARHFSRVFRELTGTPPATYIERARLHRAQALLKQSSLSIKSVARQVGYDDVHYFTRRFAHLFGQPPGAFRKSEAPPPSEIKVSGELI